MSASLDPPANASPSHPTGATGTHAGAPRATQLPTTAPAPLGAVGATRHPSVGTAGATCNRRETPAVTETVHTTGPARDAGPREE